MAGRLPEVSCVICTTPRTGSWLLADGLLATGVAGRPEEYFRADWYLRFRESGHLEYQHRLHREDNWPDATRWSDPPAFTMSTSEKWSGDQGNADRQFSRDYRSFLEVVRSIGTVHGVFAIKMHRHQLDDAVQIARQEDPNIDDISLLDSWLAKPCFVFLRRRDTIRRAVSHYRAIKSDVWWRYDDGDSLHNGNIAGPPINPEAIHRLRRTCARQERQWTDLFQRAGVKPLILTYEKLALDPSDAVMAVLRHIGIDPSRLPPLPPPRLRRQADAWTDVAVHSYVTWRRMHRPLSDRQYGFDAERR
jgi:LPS sulfotransferase NodH